MKLFTKTCCEELLQFLTKAQIRDSYFMESFDNTYFKYLNVETEYNLPADLVLNYYPEKDLENSILIFESLKEIDRVQANDKRLWITLTHTIFFEYTCKRWGIKKEDSDEKIIQRFYFEGASLQSRMRNSISRLWWAAKLTYDESREDKYELTKLLWSKQDIYQNLVERSYGTYDSVVKGFLEFYSINSYLKEGQLRRLFTALNSIGGVKVLSVHSKEDIKELLGRLIRFYEFDIAA